MSLVHAVQFGVLENFVCSRSNCAGASLISRRCFPGACCGRFCFEGAFVSEYAAAPTFVVASSCTLEEDHIHLSPCPISLGPLQDVQPLLDHIPSILYAPY